MRLALCRKLNDPETWRVRKCPLEPITPPLHEPLELSVRELAQGKIIAAEERRLDFRLINREKPTPASGCSTTRKPLYFPALHILSHDTTTDDFRAPKVSYKAIFRDMNNAKSSR
jgi:hypothetical protein